MIIENGRSVELLLLPAVHERETTLAAVTVVAAEHITAQVVVIIVMHVEAVGLESVLDGIVHVLRMSSSKIMIGLIQKVVDVHFHVVSVDDVSRRERYIGQTM